MTDHIEPALSAEEWALKQAGRLVPGLIETDDNVSGGLTMVLARPHAIAAMCLLGKPYGFTRADFDAIAALYRMGCTCGVITVEDSAEWGAAQEQIPSTLAKLAALLPPEFPGLPPDLERKLNERL